jgi:hypothetical protein
VTLLGEAMGDIESEPSVQVERWSMKDGLLVIPLLASALALTWEVGYFLEIGGGSFGLFSLAEHITFTIETLPIALALATMVMLAMFFNTVRGSAPQLRISLGVLVTMMGGVAGASIAAYLTNTAFSVDIALPILLTTIAMIPMSLLIVVPLQTLKSWMVICASLLCVFVLAFGVGIFKAQAQIKSTRPLNILKVGEKGKETETEIKVRILRTGERGVLYFDPATQSFGLLPWDHVNGSIGQLVRGTSQNDQCARRHKTRACNGRQIIP